MEQTLNIALKAGNLFRTLGLHNITMDDIAHELGISKKTLYHQVPDKSSLVNLVIDREYSEVKREAEQIIETSKNPVEELLRLNAFVVRYLKTINPSSVFDLRKQYRETYEQSSDKFSGLFANILRSNINRGKELGLYHQHIDCDVIISIHAVKYSHFQSIWEPDVTTEKIEKMAHYYLQGLVTEQGNILLQKHIVDFNNYLK